MQYPFSPLPNVMSAIEATMSPARLARYLGASKGDKNHALRLYVWNARLCEEFYIPLQFSEVSLRNSIHRRLTILYGTDWFDRPKFTDAVPNRHKEEIAKVAADERKKRGRSFTPDHVVAGMSFGFWQNLMGTKLEFVLWRDGIRAAMPHLPNGFGQAEVYRRLERLRKFRNAVMHHYAIFDKGPTDEYRNILSDPSLGIYVYHFPILLWLVKDHGITSIALYPLALLMTLPLALLSWHIVEKRALNMRDIGGGAPNSERLDAGDEPWKASANAGL